MPKGRKKTNVGPSATRGGSVASPPSPSAQPLVGPISVGAGMTAGLEIWRQGDRLVLVDRSADGRFADDVATWNKAAGGGLNGTR